MEKSCKCNHLLQMGGKHVKWSAVKGFMGATIAMLASYGWSPAAPAEGAPARTIRSNPLRHCRRQTTLRRASPPHTHTHRCRAACRALRTRALSPARCPRAGRGCRRVLYIVLQRSYSAYGGHPFCCPVVLFYLVPKETNVPVQNA